ncbi:ATP-binding protein [Hyalangium rubrum]|uniref:Adenylate/guanylate cyclase domain-containing protein n=1 Tax=Hyalangium rubrum TaxID=3103134 RepID=A0ABU5H3Z6_9BACT|nr:adenylate/guanylate cyclase domain-containing protein [Hyalangium sp. s54d21]MDY7228183.1 adenylate/guanylate cyclase domain-containing protein [Hyalangium sp. s54d21]
MNALAMPLEAPSGTVALVFTDIEGSTRLWEHCSEGMRVALELHDRILRTLLASSSGYEVKTQGDSFMVAFPTALEAMRWCLNVQQMLLEAPWPEEILAEPEAAPVRGPRGVLHRGLRVRMGIHVGEPERRLNARTGQVDYIGRMVNVASRVAEAGHGGQVLVSGAAWAQVAGLLDRLDRPVVRVLGSFRLKGIAEPVPLLEVLPVALADRRFETLRVREERRGNLPEDPGDIIGREEELNTLRLWLGEGARLITILGPGGMGKTRLAAYFGSLQMGTRQWDGGVWWCDLTEAATVEDICHVVSQALGVHLSSGGATELVGVLGSALSGRGQALIILDNLEHLTQHIPAALRRWMVMAPQVRFLITSQESLRLAGERILDLAPLGLPSEADSGVEAIARSEAVRLFVRRARAARGSFELSETEAPLVADIVRRLDGIALAIELAAARTALLGVSQIRERLSRRFDLLRGGQRDAMSRQATLRGAIDWSWNLLDMIEQAVLAQCSVFRGGFSLESAEAVLALPPGGVDVLEIVQALRSKSLLRADAPEGLPGELRLGMYESIREYASARLAETGSGPALVARHADYYLALGRELHETARRGDAEALRRLSLERENLLAVCDHALAAWPPTPESVLRALEALVVLEPDIASRGPVGITLPRLDRALEQAATLSESSLPRAEALAVRGRAHLETGELAAARRDLELARTSFQALGEVARQKRILVDLSIVARHEGNVAAAWELVQQAQHLPSGRDRWLEAYALGNLGITEQVRGGPAGAVPHLHAALELFRVVGDRTFEVLFLNNLALAIGEAGGTSEAVEFLEEAIAKALGTGNRSGYAIARLNLGCFLLDADRPMEACEHLEATVELGRQLGQRIVEGCARGELGRAFLASGATEIARMHLTHATSTLAHVSRWHALRFSLHLAAVQALQGAMQEARRGFAALGGTSEIQTDPVLRELAELLYATVELAESQNGPSGSADAGRSREGVHRRLERARNVPPEGASSDLRGWVRLLELESSPET